jgi:hypothetical protein
MSTAFPTALDTLVTKVGTDIMTTTTDNNMQDAIMALEAKVGIDSSAVSSSLTYKIALLTSQIFKSMRLVWVATSATTANISLESQYNGDVVGSTSVTSAGYNGTNFTISGSTTPGSVITIKDAAIAGTVQAVLSVTPRTDYIYSDVDTVGSVVGATIVLTMGANTSSPNMFSGIWGTTCKRAVWDIIYMAY